jgi:DNA polymerase-1
MAPKPAIKATLPTPSPHPRAVGPGDHLILVDGSNFIFRAYFQSMNQDRRYLYRSDGLPTGAVRLFCNKLAQFVREGVMGERATHLGIVFDKSENSFRKELYPAYKGNRSEPPDDLVPQFPLMREAVKAFGLIPLEIDRYEADDLIATYAKECVARGAQTTIVSADKDLMQLVRPGIAMYDPASGDQGKKGARPERKIGEAEVLEYFGVPPARVVDVQSLAGDSTDNVPGAPGIGIKTAAQLINEYGDLDTLLLMAREIKQPKRRDTLTDPEIVAKIRVSKQLVSLVDDAPLPHPLDDLGLADPDPRTLIGFLKAMEFTTITRKLGEELGVDVAELAAEPRLAAVPGRRFDAPLSPDADTPQLEPQPGEPATPARGNGVAAPPADAVFMPAHLALARQAEAAASRVTTDSYETVTSLERLRDLLQEAVEGGLLAFSTRTTSPDPMQAELIGFSLSTKPGRAAYVPLAHVEGAADLFSGETRISGQVEVPDALELLKPCLEQAGVLKLGHNIKYDWVVMARYGIDLRPFDDTMLMSYALDGGAGGGHDLSGLAQKWLGHTASSLDAVTGTGKNRLPFARVSLDRATTYAAEQADIAMRLWRVLKPRLTAEGMTTVYETLERPLISVLGRMERRGIAIDRAILSRLSGDFAQRMAALEHEIHELAGENFNLGSPKQLGDILFGKMQLPGAKKTATGQWGTGAGVLEDLADQGHVLPARILDWRQLSKLKSTYADSLPSYVHPETRRVHTCFALAATTTGRLSSSEPNIQNIPIRNEEGRKIRTAFVATPGHRLVSADYSQIELRVLAHMADIPLLRQAFAEGLDIHAMTASEMFGVPIEGMPSDVRRRAKAINFGIIYGISAFGLANQLGIGREEAGAYIRKYFERFPGIRDYMEETKKQVHRDGYVRTIFGRKCHYPQIGTRNPSERAFYERAAINAPIQGSAADIIRRAMTRMEPALSAAHLSAQMLLQVHDELIFEVPEADVDATLPVVRRVMEDAAHPAVQLAVPLKVDARAALNWDEAH